MILRKAELGILILAVALEMQLAGCLINGSKSQNGNRPDYAAEHGRMMLRVEEAGVRDPLVLEALRTVPRHQFIPEEVRDVASSPQTVSSDSVLFARIVELLRLQGGESVLQIGTGSGYEAAVLSRIVDRVYSVEILPNMVKAASKRLLDMGYTNVYIRCSDPVIGWEKQAPFDAVIVGIPVERIPQALINQLKDGGRLIIPVGNEISEKTFSIITKSEGKIVKKMAFPSDSEVSNDEGTNHKQDKDK